jgi:Ni,Fe-hydrogenase III component G
MEVLDHMQVKLVSMAERVENPDPERMDVYLSNPFQLSDAAKRILDDGGWHLSAITGMDLPQSESYEGGTELLYHFCKGPFVVTLRIRVTYGDPVAPTVCDLIPSATLYEREAMEMFGVIFDGTPDRARLLLPDDWPDGVYPMRKSFKQLDQ